MSQEENNTVIDKFGFLSVAKVLEVEGVVIDDKRKSFVIAKKNYFKAIIALSDKIDSLPENSEVDIETFISELAMCSYTMQGLITVLSSQVPDEEGVTIEPYTHTAKQLNEGMDTWIKDINTNLMAVMTSLEIDDTQVTMHGVEVFVNTLMNVDTPDVVLGTYFNLVKYLELFELTTVKDINAKIIEIAQS